MSSTLYLIGGGEIRDGDTQLIDQDVLLQAPQGSTFVFFGFAAHDSTDYADTIASVFGHRYNIVVPTVAKGKQFAIDAIQSAAVIYLGGGDTDELLRVFAEWGLVSYLQTAIDKGTCVAGMSAGTLALSTWYVHEENDVFELRKGWGIVPVGTLVHANQASYDKAMLLLSEHDMSGTYPLVAIGEGAAWRIHGDEATKVGSGPVWTFPVQGS